jgi:hypothetical protein
MTEEEFKTDFPDVHRAVEEMVARMTGYPLFQASPAGNDSPAPTNPMIAAALASGNDATGLCTVRQWAEDIVAWPKQGVPRGTMAFDHNGKRYTVEMVVTKVEVAT